MTDQLNNIEPLGELTPIDAFVLAGMGAAALRGLPLTPEVVADTLGLPEGMLSALYHIEPIVPVPYRRRHRGLSRGMPRGTIGRQGYGLWRSGVPWEEIRHTFNYASTARLRHTVDSYRRRHGLPGAREWGRGR